MSHISLKKVLVPPLIILVLIFLTSCGGRGEVPKVGNLASFGQFQSQLFSSADMCMSCHADIHTQWSNSMHNNSYKDPLYQKVYELAIKDTNGDRTIEAFCIACHNPIGFISGEIPPADGSKLSQIAKDGIQCDFCHTVSGSHGIGDFSAKNSPGEIKRGPLKDAASPSHKTAYSELHTKAEFCGMCHNVSHPVNGLHLENTYSEWKAGPYSAQGIVCQDCHMTPGPGVTKPNPGQAALGGPNRPHIYTHSIVGGNVAMAEQMGSPDHAALARERLRAAASVEILPAKRFSAGENKFKVKVTNKGAGHYLPTGLTETREMWLEVVVKDGYGKTVFSSGELDKEGNIGKNAVIYNTVVGDSEGKPTHLVWRAEKILRDHRIPPKESVTENYSFKLPVNAKGPFKIEATLNYRSASQAIVDELFEEEAFELPVVDMAHASAIVN